MLSRARRELWAAWALSSDEIGSVAAEALLSLGMLVEPGGAGELERLRAQLLKCVLTAPQDGIVIYAKRYYWDDASEIRPGAQVHFQQPIVTLPDLDRMQVKLRVHESVVKKAGDGESAAKDSSPRAK